MRRPTRLLSLVLACASGVIGARAQSQAPPKPGAEGKTGKTGTVPELSASAQMPTRRASINRDPESGMTLRSWANGSSQC